jgi:hypothetical protein
VTVQKETVITTKKTTTVIPKKPVKTSIIKPLLNTNNSEKQSVRPPLTASSSKPIEKKSSDISNSTTITATKKSTEPSPAKPPPVTLGKIPKLNPANKQKPMPSKSLTDQKLDLLASGGNVNNNKEPNTSEKNLPKRYSPQRLNRPQQNPVDNSDPFAPLSPMDLVDSTDNSIGKQSSTRYPSLLDNNPLLTSNFSRTNSIGLENTQSQSPLSPVKNIVNKKKIFFSFIYNFRVLHQHSILHHHHQLYHHHHHYYLQLDQYLHQQKYLAILVTINLMFNHQRMNFHNHLIEKIFQHHLLFHDQVLHQI